MAYYLDIKEEELQQITEEIGTILGAHTIEVDLTKKEILIMLRRSHQEFEKETSIWQLKNQFGNIYGTPAGLIQQNQLATMNFQLPQQITDWFKSMSRVGGKIPWHKDYIVLEPGRQIYDLSKESSKPYAPGTRRVNRVMWCAKPEILNFSRFSNTNPNGDDVLYSSNWNFTTNGLNYGASPLSFLGYSMDTIMLMQSAESRNKILFSEFFHNLSGDILEITPMPGIGVSSFPQGMKVFYYYWDESEVVINGRNPFLDVNGPASEIVGGSYRNDVTAQNLIANPVDMMLGYTMYNSLSPWAKSWIFDYTLARCKYIQASKWRKIKKTMATGEMSYEIEFDYQSLLSEASDEMKSLTESLKKDLEEINVLKLMQDKAEMVQAAGKVSSKHVRQWSFMSFIFLFLSFIQQF